MRDIIVLSQNTFERMMKNVEGDQWDYIESVEFQVNDEVPDPFINVIADYGGLLTLQVADLDYPRTPQCLTATVMELTRCGFMD